MAYIKRKLFEKLKNHLKAKEISLIVGPRQVGKTTLMRSLKDFLDERKEKTLFLNYDYEADKQYFSSQNTLLKKIKLEFGDKKGFIFIDEIQRKEDAGLFLKGIYDLNLPHKFIVSGSGSLELKEKIHESLAGRKRMFELYAVDFAEFVNFKTNYQYEEKLEDFFSVENKKTNLFLEEYLNFGGYPRIILEETFSEKKKLIDEIFKSYLERDIAYLLNVEKTEAFGGMIKLLANQAGQLVNYSEIAAYLGISVPTIKKYIWYSEKTFIIRRLSPFFRNKRKEITKSPVAYFTDLGLRNYALNIFGQPGSRQQESFLFQNLVANIFYERLMDTAGVLHFWRTKDKAEVDLVVENGQEIKPIEIKYSSFLKKREIERSLRNFIEKYNPPNALIVNLDFRGEEKIGDTVVKFLPFYDLFVKNEHI